MKNRITLLLTVLVICLSLPLLTASAEDTHEHDFINGGYRAVGSAHRNTILRRVI